MEVKISRLVKNKTFVQNLRFDLTPELLFRPRFPQGKSPEDLCNETQGFFLYVDFMEGMPKPILMLMKNYQLRSKTVGEVTDAPEEFLWDAVKGVKDIQGMYPLSPALETWIKQELEKAE